MGRFYVCRTTPTQRRITRQTTTKGPMEINPDDFWTFDVSREESEATALEHHPALRQVDEL